jgi:hypothetical protein
MGYSKDYLGELFGVKKAKDNLENIESEKGLGPYYLQREKLPVLYRDLDINL